MPSFTLPIIHSPGLVLHPQQLRAGTHAAIRRHRQRALPARHPQPTYSSGCSNSSMNNGQTLIFTFMVVMEYGHQVEAVLLYLLFAPLAGPWAGPMIRLYMPSATSCRKSSLMASRASGLTVILAPNHGWYFFINGIRSTILCQVPAPLFVRRYRSWLSGPPSMLRQDVDPVPGEELQGSSSIRVPLVVIAQLTDRLRFRAALSGIGHYLLDQRHFQQGLATDQVMVTSGTTARLSSRSIACLAVASAMRSWGFSCARNSIGRPGCS